MIKKLLPTIQTLRTKRQRSQGRLHRTPGTVHALNSSVTSHIVPQSRRVPPGTPLQSRPSEVSPKKLTQAAPQHIIWQKPNISVLLGTFPHQEHGPAPSPLQVNIGVWVCCLVRQDNFLREKKMAEGNKAWYLSFVNICFWILLS